MKKYLVVLFAFISVVSISMAQQFSYEWLINEPNNYSLAAYNLNKYAGFFYSNSYFMNYSKVSKYCLTKLDVLNNIVANYDMDKEDSYIFWDFVVKNDSVYYSNYLLVHDTLYFRIMKNIFSENKCRLVSEKIKNTTLPLMMKGFSNTNYIEYLDIDTKIIPKTIKLNRFKLNGDSLLEKVIYTFDSKYIIKSNFQSINRTNKNIVIFVSGTSKENNCQIVEALYYDLDYNFLYKRIFKSDKEYTSYQVINSAQLDSNIILLQVLENTLYEKNYSSRFVKYSMQSDSIIWESSENYFNEYSDLIKLNDAFIDNSQNIHIFSSRNNKSFYSLTDINGNFNKSNINTNFFITSHFKDNDDIYVTGGMTGGDQAFIRKFDVVSDILEEIPCIYASLYPNPAGDRVNIEFDETLGVPESVEIFDILGNKVNGLQVYRSSGSVIVSTVSLSTGTYTARIMLGGNFIAKSFVVGR